MELGEELLDGFQVTDVWVSNGIKWLDEIQAFYKEKALLDKDYSNKTKALTKRFMEKKLKRSAQLSVGETPSSTPGSLEASSVATWGSILTEVEEIAKFRESSAVNMESSVCTALKGIAHQTEEVRKECNDHMTRLSEAKDKYASFLKKQKLKYDEACNMLESARRKNHGSKGKQYMKSLAEMGNAKNAYIIALNAANALKYKYYHIDMPELLNRLQLLNEKRVASLNKCWATANSIDSGFHEQSLNFLKEMLGNINDDIPSLDTEIFANHNEGKQETSDFEFEPSPIWLDDANLITEEESKVVLTNRIVKAKDELSELFLDIEEKRRNLEADNFTVENDSSTDEDLYATLAISIKKMSELALKENRRVELAVEIQTITNAAGELNLTTFSHKFKPTTFALPTTCDYCHHKIWGNKKALTCKSCNINLHTKCEYKIEPNCGLADGKSKGSKKEGSATATISSTIIDNHGSIKKSYSDDSLSNKSAHSVNYYGIPNSPDTPTSAKIKGDKFSMAFFKRHAHAASSSEPITSPIVTEEPKISSSSKATVLYTFTAAGPSELDVEGGETVDVLQPDDGNGWALVATGTSQGLVPTSYIRVLGAAPKVPPSLPPKRRQQSTLPTVKALYDFTAQSDYELTISSGDVITVISPDAGDGWTKGELHGNQGSFPSSYVSPM